MARQTRNVPKRGRAVEAASRVDLADAKETLADRPASPQHRVVVPKYLIQIIAEVSKALPIKSLAPRAAVEVPVAPEIAAVSDAKAESGATAAPTDAEKFRRVSTRQTRENLPAATARVQLQMRR